MWSGCRPPTPGASFRSCQKSLYSQRTINTIGKFFFCLQNKCTSIPHTLTPTKTYWDSGIWTKHVCFCIICIHGWVCAVWLLGSRCVPKVERFHCADEMFALQVRRNRWDIDQHSLNTSNCGDTRAHTQTQRHTLTHTRTQPQEHVQLTNTEKRI